MDEYELKELINFLISKQKNKSKIYDSKDLYQEAMLVVPIAIKTWDKKRGAALRTHLTNCIVNRFKDLHKSQHVQEEYYYEDFGDVGLAIPEDPICAFEFDLTMKKILNELEFAVYRKYYVYGHTTRDIRSMFKISSKRVDLCLRSICAKFQSLEESLQKISTQRKLSENFLYSSERAS